MTFFGCGNCEIMAGEGGTAVTNGYQYVLSGDDKTDDFKVPGVDAAEGYKYVNWVNDFSGSFKPWYADSRNGRLTWDSVKDIAGWDGNTGYVNIMAQCEGEIVNPDAGKPDEYNVTYKYVDENGVENVPAEVPKNDNTYSVDQLVPVATAPDNVTVGGGVWKFQGWTVNGVGVSGSVKIGRASCRERV